MPRLSGSQQLDASPVWAPDGRHIAFQSTRNSKANIYWIRGDGSGDTVRLTESENPQTPYSFSPDGKRLAFEEKIPDTDSDIWTLPLDLSDPDHPRPGKPEPFLRTPVKEWTPAFSPDGRWLAYTEQRHVCVKPFPGPGGKFPIGGAQFPVWSRNGNDRISSLRRCRL